LKMIKTEAENINAV